MIEIHPESLGDFGTDYQLPPYGKHQFGALQFLECFAC